MTKVKRMEEAMKILEERENIYNIGYGTGKSKAN